ncbi:ABC transporter permease [Streptomyces sp. ISL-90]|nr:ABC transporter permease [Streptomyces sp. ISL-90]
MFLRISGDGVEVAAPIANLGYVNVVGTAYVDLRSFVNDGASLFRVDPTYAAANGAARYSDAPRYLYYTESAFDGEPQGVTTVENDSGAQRWPCWYFNVDPLGTGSAPQRPFRQETDAFVVGQSAFDPELRTGLECYSSVSPSTSSGAGITDQPDGFVGVSIPVAFPVLIAAIDAEQEAALVGLEDAVTEGSYLLADEQPSVERVQGRGMVDVPVLLSTDAFADVTMGLSVTRLDIGGTRALDQLDSPAARPWLTGLSGSKVGEINVDLTGVFEPLAQSSRLSFGVGPANSFSPEVGNYWTTGPVAYDDAGGRLEASIKPSPEPQTWAAQWTKYDQNIPVDNQATQVRDVTLIEAAICSAGCEVPRPFVTGRFDPEEITGFSGLSRLPLESYRQPEVTGADERTREILHNDALLPDRNLGGYLRQPPAMLTTLQSITAFLSSRADAERSASTPISSIRIRVAGVSGVDELSRSRINAVVAGIKNQLGDSVVVEVTVGASPAPQQVVLPAGVAGAEQILVEEYWAEKGVGVRIVNAIDAKSGALFVLVLVVCTLYLAQGALASVRTRRAEIATLLGMGWARATAFLVIAAELLVIGALGGFLGALVAWVTAGLLGIGVATSQVLLAIPLAVLVALVAGLIPAWLASRILPVEAFRPPVAPVYRSRQVRTPLELALANVARGRTRTILGAAGLALAVAALTILLGMTIAFRGQVAGTLLGTVVTAEVRDVDFLAVAVSMGLGTVALVDVLLMNQRERAGEYAVLSATGWSTSELAQVTRYEGIAMAIMGGFVGAALGAAVVIAMGGPLVTPEVVIGMLVATGSSMVGGLAVVLLVLLGSTSQVAQMPPATILAADE